MKLRRDHLLTPEGFFHGFVIVALLVLALLVYRALHQPLGTPPLTTTHTTNLVPAVGAEGYDVEAFCNDPATTVARDFVAPPDSTFGATYNLDRTKDGVHEVVTVGVYADPSKQPLATHYGPDNTPADGFTSVAALKCIEAKAK